MADKESYFSNEQKLAKNVLGSIETLRKVQEQLSESTGKDVKVLGADNRALRDSLDVLLKESDPGNNGLGSIITILSNAHQLSANVVKYSEEYQASLAIEKQRITELNKHAEWETSKQWFFKSIRWGVGIFLAVVLYSGFSKLSDPCDPAGFWKIPIKDIVVDCSYWLKPEKPL